ncbi:hypothetical protein MLD38_000912 [Melastoma candidum]|uniref:Uncharacterized protein n=1 Tax=Melastoma candidum TaxID=119954 RepID=A0ACB9SD59_9MYRT|nr:hypothetical protein MLD38_000912 [Melastoma candidum]
MNTGDLHKVWEIKALKKPGEDKARAFLDRIAKQVQPIMRKRRWRVKILSEFCPKNGRLLGLNVGKGIAVKLRLRRPNREDEFFPYNNILDTMLHELCHIVHGPHDAKFYALWDELRKECEQLMENGITGTGQGFDLQGRHLGGLSRQPPISSLRKTALSAAEKRKVLGSLLPSGPRRLGGDSSLMALSPAQAAAMAAERRLQDDIWCGSTSEDCEDKGSCDRDVPKNVVNMVGSPRKSRGSSSSAPGVTSRKRHLDSGGSLAPKSFNRDKDTNFIDLTAMASTSTSESSRNNRGSRHQKGRSQLNESLRSPSRCHRESACNSSLTSNSKRETHEDLKHPEENTWACEMCTFLNPPLSLVCKICGLERRKDSSVAFKFWSCKFCTLDNSVGLDRCSACQQWRYSHGSPVSTRAPVRGD